MRHSSRTGRWTLLSVLGLAMILSFPQVMAKGGNGLGGCCWLAEVDALYWKPWGADFYPADLIVNPSNTEIVDCPVVLRPGYDWGVRVRGAAAIPCLCAEVSLTYIYSNARGRFQHTLSRNEFLLLSQAIAVEDVGSAASAHERFQHHLVDLLVEKPLWNDCGVGLRVLAGLRYLYLENHYDFLVELPTSDQLHIRERSCFSGAGPVIGLRTRWCFCRDIGLFGQLDLGAVIGEVDDRYSLLYDQVSENFFVRERRTILSPALGGEVGISYCCCLCGLEVCGKLGYHYRTYFRSALAVILMGAGNELSLVELHSISIGGPYLGLSATF